MQGPLSEAGFNSTQIDKIVAITGPKTQDGIGFTFSDLTQRLLPTLVVDAYPDKAITFDRAVAIAQGLSPTPQFQDGARR
ncbi:hypothetical protein D3C86_2081510 [compost metagenome]